MKKKHPEHVNLERWLVSYADFITLLFAFFVVMYAISNQDKAKLKAAAESIKKAFGTAGPVGMINLGGRSGGATANPFEHEEMPGGRVMNLPAGKTNTAADPDPGLQEVREILEESISLELGVTELSEKVQMVYDSRGLVVRLAAKDFFDAGEADVRIDLRPILDRIGRTLSTSRRLIRIEGHTDPAESDMAGYASGWELSAARASWVARFWTKRHDFDLKRVGVAGYSHYRPLTDSKTEWGKASNRRVEIIVLNNIYESP